MAVDKKISELTPGGPAQAADILPIDRSGSNFSLTAQNIADLAPATPPGGSTGDIQVNAGGGDFGGISVVPLSQGGTNVDLSATGGATKVLAQDASHVVSARDLIAADIPSLDAAKITTGQIALARGGTGVDLSATGSSTAFLAEDASHVVSARSVTDADLSTSDITTNDVSTSKHGFAPKAPNDATKYLDGTGAYSIPAGSGGTGNVNAGATLTSNQIVIGQGSEDVATLGSLGTTTTVLHGNAGGAPSYGAVVEADITLTDNTTDDVSITKHGFAPKAPNDATKFLDGTGAYSVPSSSATPQYASFNQVFGIVANGSAATSSGFAPIGAGIGSSGFSVRTDNVYIQVAATAADPASMGQTNTAAANRLCSIQAAMAASQAIITPQGCSWFKSRVKISVYTHTMLFIGLSNIADGTVITSDLHANLVIGFRAIAGTDTNYKCITCDGTTQHLTDSGVAVDTNPHSFLIVPNGGTSIDFYIDGVKVVSGETNNLPLKTTALAPRVSENQPASGAFDACQINIYHMWYASTAS